MQAPIVLGTLISLTTVVIEVLLIGVLMAQRVYAHIRAVKRLLVEALVAFLGVELLLMARRFLPLDATVTALVVRGVFSLSLYSVAALGTAATILYRRPRSTSWREMYLDLVRSAFLPFLLFIAAIFVLLALNWTLPLALRHGGCPASAAGIYMPILEPVHIVMVFAAFLLFLIYPTLIFVIASNSAQDEQVSRGLGIFAACMVGLALTILLQPLFLSRCFPEAVEIIRIPCLIALTWVFRRNTAIQSFYDVELREYLEDLKRRRKQ